MSRSDHIPQEQLVIPISSVVAGVIVANERKRQEMYFEWKIVTLLTEIAEKKLYFEAKLDCSCSQILHKL